MTPKFKKWMFPLYFCLLKIWRIFIPAITWKVMLLAGITFSFIIYCSDSTSSGNTVTVSGSVTLQGKTDHSGVKISLYKPVELDTAIVRLNQEYPGLGVAISQKTEFDHREHNPAYSTQSNGDGSWAIDNVTSGNYHVVAEKDSFGWKYLYNKNVNSSITIDTLNRTIYLSNTLSKNLSVNNSVLVIDNLLIPETKTLQVGAGSTLLLKDNAKIEVKGALIFTGTVNRPVKVLAYDSQPWRMIEGENEAILQIEYCVFSNSLNGIRNRGANLIFQHNIIRSSSIGLENFAVTNEIYIMYNLFSKNQISIYNNGVDASNVERNLFISNEEALRIESSQKSTIKQNVFRGDSIALNINPTGGFGYQNSNVSIMSCEFEDNYTSIILGPKTAESFGHENNFIRTEKYFIDVKGTATPIDTLNFRDNYWGLSSIIDIKLKINDYTDHDLTKYFYYIEVENFAYNPFNVYWK